MERQFGKLLKRLMKIAGKRERELSAAANYDITYISKWLNGSKLPMKANLEDVLSSISLCLLDNLDGYSRSEMTAFLGLEPNPKDSELKRAIEKKVMEAYSTDRFYFDMQSNIGEKKLSYFDSKLSVVELIKTSLRTISEVNGGRITISSSFDLMGFLGSRFQDVAYCLKKETVESLDISLCVDTETMLENYTFYCLNILDAIINYRHVELTLHHSMPEDQKILIINDILLIHIVQTSDDNFTAYCTTDEHIISSMNKYLKSIHDTREILLGHAPTEILRKTNVQLDSYSNLYQKQFFNEAPSSLLPPEVMDHLITEAGPDSEYGTYLIKLKNIFAKYTSKSSVDLILYTSVLNQYVQDGKMSLGNVPHILTREQVAAHLQYICNCMRSNPNLKVFVIRDTIHMGSITKYHPSIFLDRNSLTIENSKGDPMQNYHLSMNRKVNEMFDRFVTDIENQSSCALLTPDELERYL